MDDDACCSTAGPTVHESVTTPESAALRDDHQVTFKVEELDCATEEHELRNALGKVAGVSNLTFDLVARRVTIVHDLPDPAPLAATIKALGMRPERVTDDPTQPDRTIWGLRPRHLLATVFGGVLAVGSEIAVLAGADETGVLVAAMALTSIALTGRQTLRKGLRSLLARRFTMSLLMSVAVIGAIAIGQWPEAAVVIWLFGLAETIEALSLERARHAIRSLVTLVPETTLVRDGDVTIERDTGGIALGEVFVVRPGERVALDGIVVAGTSTIDQAPITGESIPVTKDVGDPVFAGTVNQRGSIDVRVTAAKGTGTLDRIAQAIQTAQSERAPAQRFVDQFAAVYTPIVFVAAVLVATVPVALGHGTFDDWLYRALVLLVLACPCALVISTPVTVVAALGGAARRGILIKGGVHLEGARKIKVLAVDKTGTLTYGRPTVTDVHCLTPSLTKDKALQLAASADSPSEHPIAHAVTTAWKGELLPVEDFQALPGLGVSAIVDGRPYWLGNHRLVEQRGRCSPEVESVLAAYEQDAKTAVVLLDDDGPLAVLAVADEVRAETVEAVRQLHQVGVDVVMLTGDNVRTAEAVARQVDISEVHADLLPEDKLALVGELARRGPVAMIGDGINDAPALAKADLGVAMGAAGTDTAIETADVALMDDDPRKLAEVIRISQHTTHVLWQNIVFALTVKAIFFGLTFIDVTSLWLAVLADMGASLIVIANGLRLLSNPSHGHGTSSVRS